MFYLVCSVHQDRPNSPWYESYHGIFECMEDALAFLKVWYEDDLDDYTGGANCSTETCKVTELNDKPYWPTEYTEFDSDNYIVRYAYKIDYDIGTPYQGFTEGLLIEVTPNDDNHGWSVACPPLM